LVGTAERALWAMKPYGKNVSRSNKSRIT